MTAVITLPTDRTRMSAHVEPDRGDSVKLVIYCGDVAVVFTGLDEAQAERIATAIEAPLYPVGDAA